MPSNDPIRRFRDIIENAELIRRITTDMTLGQFEADIVTRYAVERALLIISEAAIKLGDVAERLAPGQPWSDIRGIGNQLRHRYDDTSATIVWNVAQNRIAQLVTDCEAACQALTAGGRDTGG